MSPEIFSGIAGLFLNYIVEIVKAKLPETPTKWLGFVLSYGACVLVGLASAFFQGKFDPQNILNSAAAALLVSQTYYNLYFKPSGQDARLNSLIRD